MRHRRMSLFDLLGHKPRIDGSWRIFLVAIAFAFVNLPTARAVDPAAENSAPQQSDYVRLAEQIESHFLGQVLPFWFPRCIDEQHGGFHPHFRSDGNPGPRNEKTIVFQARMTWVAAEVARRYPDRKAEFQAYAEHGLKFLRDVLWDSEKGGFFWGLDENGNPLPSYGTEKHLYGIAFGLYAASNVYRLTGSHDALALAQKTFRWLEEHAYDKQHGGYFEAYHRDGTPILSVPPDNANGRARPTRDLLGTPYGFKSMNSHIHILEALTELYRAWPDPQVRDRLLSIFLVVRDKIAVEPGCLNLYFTPDWRAVPDHDSFGHDVETAFLLLEAAEVLGIPDDRTTRRVAKSLVDHALEYGWDSKFGGFYDKGTAFGPPYGLEKIWWTQAEGLNALLLMHELFGQQDSRYWTAFLKQWQFIRKYQVHPQAGEWFDTVLPDGKPVEKDLGHIWKAAYHNGRALMLSASRLRHLAGLSGKE